jgi:hypothetical protein
LCWNAISGFVFIDENRNGAMDRGESAVPGAKIAFQQAVVTVSNDRGYYAIDLVCGEYEVIATAPDLIGRTVVSVGEVVAGLTNIPMAPVKRQLLPLIIGH